MFERYSELIFSETIQGKKVKFNICVYEIIFYINVFIVVAYSLLLLWRITVPIDLQW